MTPDSPSPSDGKPLSPRHRTKLDSLAKDTTELDLWDFGDDEESARKIPSPRTGLPEKHADKPSPAHPAARQEDDEGDDDSPPKLIPRQRSRRSGKALDTPEPAAGDPHHSPGIDDLGEWDEPDEPEISETPEASALPDADPAPEEPSPSEPASEPSLESDAPPETPVEPPAEPSPQQTTPPPPARKILFSRAELISIGVLALLLLIGGVFFLTNSLNRLPTEQEGLTTRDFPIQGKFLTASSAETYWREPVLTGDNRDTVRHNTQLIPVIEVATRKGPAAIRVFFRDSDGKSVGDPISRPVRGETTLVIPATAGFEDTGMHAAYRTGDTKPWTVEILEGPSENASGSEFSPLFKIAISTARR